MSVTNNDRLKVDLKWSVAGVGLAANIFQCRVYQAAPYALADADVLADMEAWMTDFLAPIETYVIVDATILSSPVYKWQTGLWNLIGMCEPDFTSSGIGDPLPSGVAALIDVYTFVSRVIGKKYIPGLQESCTTAGVWIAGVLSALADMASVWLLPFESLTGPNTLYVPGVYSTKTTSFQDFQAETRIPNVPAYQRRRKAGVGS